MLEHILSGKLAVPQLSHASSVILMVSILTGKSLHTNEDLWRLCAGFDETWGLSHNHSYIPLKVKCCHRFPHTLSRQLVIFLSRVSLHTTDFFLQTNDAYFSKSHEIKSACHLKQWTTHCVGTPVHRDRQKDIKTYSDTRIFQGSIKCHLINHKNYQCYRCYQSTSVNILKTAVVRVLRGLTVVLSGQMLTSL